MHLRRTLAIAACLTTLLADLGAAAHAADRRPPKPKPDLVVAGVFVVPRQVQAGRRFAVKALLHNRGDGRSKRSRVTLYLSPGDATRGAGDLLVGRATAPAVGPGKPRLQPVPAKVPASARRGFYFVLACVGPAKKQRCKSSRRSMDVVKPVNGRLSGTLALVDKGAAGPTTWQRTAEVSVSMDVSGMGQDTRVVDNGSSYTWKGRSTTDTSTPDCVVTQTEDEEMADLFDHTEDPISDLTGKVLSLDLGDLRITAKMRQKVDGTMTACDVSVPIDEVRETTTILELERVSQTTSSITYRVVTPGPNPGVPTPWETVTGSLRLTLR